MTIRTFWQLRRRGDRSGNCVGDVVELRSRGDIEAQSRELFNRSRAFCCEELKSYFEEACCTAKPPR